MPKENQNLEAQMEEDVQARPNRDEYSKMWGEDNGDIDFEDKEARYGRAIEDRNELRERRKADSMLGGIFDRHNWLASMYAELRDNPDMDVFEWLEGFCNENDLSIQDVLNNPDARKRLNEKLETRKKDQDEKAKKASGMKDRLQKTYDSLAKEFPDKTPEEIDQLWLNFWNIVEDANNGVVDIKTLKDFSNAMSYEADMENARNEGAMKARNEKIQNNVRKPSQDLSNIPPTLSQGKKVTEGPKLDKPKSFSQTMFEGIE